MQSLFIDGQRVATRDTETRSGGPLGGPGPGVGIGCVQGPSDQVLHGMIDEVRISRAALEKRQLLPPPETIR